LHIGKGRAEAVPDRDHRQWSGHGVRIRERPTPAPLPDDQAPGRGARSHHRQRDRPTPRRPCADLHAAGGRNRRPALLPAGGAGAVTESGAELPRILIVEDDPFLLEQLTWALQGRFTVISAGDATEGRARLTSERPDLYLFDLRLPPSRTVEEGFGLLREAQRRDPDATVVIMSG